MSTTQQNRPHYNHIRVTNCSEDDSASCRHEEAPSQDPIKSVNINETCALLTM